jgi:AraC-like DNA-binding protein
MDSLYIIGFIQAVFFSSLILSKKERLKKDYFLSAFILSMGMNLAFIYTLENDVLIDNPLLILLDYAYWTLLGPLLFLYIEFVIHVNRKLSWKHLIHILPTLIVFIAFSEYIFGEKENVFFQYTSEKLLFKIGYFIWMATSPAYYLASIFVLYLHKRKIKNFFSNTSKVNLNWLNYLTHGFAIFLLFLFTNNWIEQIVNIEINYSYAHLSWFVLVVYIFGIGYFGYKQDGVFSDKIVRQSKTLKLGNSNVNSYEKSGLDEIEASKLQIELIQYMETEKPYLECELNLKDLADALNTSQHKLSQVINGKLDSNFYEFVNGYRINEVKQRLLNPQNDNLKIISLAYDSGFNSKSTFYTIFKKATSYTPSEFKKRIHVNN